MTAMFVAWLVIAVLVVIAAYLENWLSWVLILLIPFTVVQCAKTDNYQTHERESKAQEDANWKRKTTPRVISTSPDGCTVYVFTTDRDHYFTRCGSQVSTETTWKESCGKNCSKDRSDVMLTEGNK